LARAGAEIKKTGLLTSWYDFSWLFYRNVDDFMRQESHATVLTELLAELVDFAQAFSGKFFTDNLFELLERFDPPHSWLKPYLPAPALAEIGEMEEIRRRREEDDRRQLDEMYY